MQNIEAEQSTTTEVTAYLSHLQNKGQHNKTRNINLNILKHYFNYQIENDNRIDNPASHIKIRGVKTKQLHAIFTKEELESLYKNYTIPSEEDSRHNKNWFTNYKLSKQRNKAILSLMIYQGLATDEINRLTLQDVRLKDGTVFISGTRKSNERLLELKPHQIMALMEYQLATRTTFLKLQPKASEAYFLQLPSVSNKSVNDALKTDNCINVWKRLTTDIKAQNKKFTGFTQVRASVITHWLKQYNLRQVQYMAGHRFISSTESYLANQVEELQNDIDSYHPIG